MAAVGVSSQIVSIFKLLFGRPQVMILESVAVDPQQSKQRGKLVKSLSTVFNAEEDLDKL